MGYGQFCPVAVACEVRRREVDVCRQGSRHLVRSFPGWLLLSHFAGVERPRPARAS